MEVVTGPFEQVIQWLVSPLRSIGDGLNQLGQGISNVISIIRDKITDLLDTIKSWFVFTDDSVNSQSDGVDHGVIGNFFVNAFKYMFVPSDDFLSATFNSFKSSFEEKMGYENYTNFINQFQNVGSGTLDNVDVNIMGVNATIINFSPMKSILTTLQDYLRGFIFAMLVLYNINQVYKLIRGTSLIEMFMKAGGK